MNAELDNIVTSPINDYITRFEKVYSESLHSDVKLINTIIRYISRKKENNSDPAFVYFQPNYVVSPLKILTEQQPLLK